MKHRAVIESRLKHKEIVTGLCEDILGSFQACLQLAEQMAQSGPQVPGLPQPLDGASPSFRRCQVSFDCGPLYFEGFSFVCVCTRVCACA